MLMKAQQPSKRHGAPGKTRHPDPEKRKALELGARAEHETGVKRERLTREAARRAD